MKTVSTQAILALKDALANLYWRKDDLKRFLDLTLENNTITSTLDWTNPKFEICSSLIDRMALKPTLFENDLIKLIKEVSSFDDFSHLQYWDKDRGGELTRKAKKGVEMLRNLSSGYFDKMEQEKNATVNRKNNQVKIQNTIAFQDKLAKIKEDFMSLSVSLNMQQRGFKLEALLNELFQLFDLDPKAPYKIVGEQIDGSFSFQSQDYLLEAKWQKKPVDLAALYAFAGKIENKFKSTVGLFVSLEGFSSQSIDGKSNTIKSMILMDGMDLMMILDGRIRLDDMILLKRRHASDTGEIFHRFT